MGKNVVAVVVAAVVAADVVRSAMKKVLFYLMKVRFFGGLSVMSNVFGEDALKNGVQRVCRGGTDFLNHRIPSRGYRQACNVFAEDPRTNSVQCVRRGRPKERSPTCLQRGNRFS